jgi:hypothetical protein
MSETRSTISSLTNSTISSVAKNIPTSFTDIVDKWKSLDQQFQTYLIFTIITIIAIVYLGWMSYLSSLQTRNCTFMNDIYSEMNGNISSMKYDTSANLFDYYIKTAYNACSGGSYKNDYVDICNLKAIIKQGVRCLDFEVYSIDNQPVVSTSTIDDYHVKETFNYVPFGGKDSVMETINGYAFASGTAPNPTDPLIIHLRIKSNNLDMISNLASIFGNYSSLMLGKQYSYENEGKNLGRMPLSTFQNKIILIVDKNNTTFMQNDEFLEYVNMTSNSVFMRSYHYFDVYNTHDVNELTNFNKTGLTIVLPDKGINPPNPSPLYCRTWGCQMVAMRYQYVDSYLISDASFFDEDGHAFVLKPYDLRYHPIIVPDPNPPVKEYSYETRNITTPWYNFDF